MAIRTKNGLDYGDEQADISVSLDKHSKHNYQATHFKDATCECRGHLFRLCIDDGAGVAIRTCIQCGHTHYMGDSEDFLDEAQPVPCACLCNSEIFEVTAGIALYRESNNVKWLYIACRCIECSLIGVYGDWKNEYEDYTAFLQRI